MKRIKKVVIAALTLILFSLPLGACTYSDSERSGNFGILYGTYMLNSKFSIGGVGISDYTWDGDSNNTDIVIPDTYNNQKVTSLGGYIGRGVPCPFTIDSHSYMPESTWTKADYEAVKSNPQAWGEEINYNDFTLRIGKNVDKIYADSKVFVKVENNASTLYCSRVYITCDEDNKTFYSNDGKLYYKESDKLVEGFIYKDNE